MIDTNVADSYFTSLYLLFFCSFNFTKQIDYEINIYCGFGNSIQSSGDI